MICPNCGSENVTIEIQQVSTSTKKHGNGIGGHLNNAARGVTAFCTLGISNLVWKKSKGNEKTVVKNEKICLCQNCGNSWANQCPRRLCNKRRGPEGKPWGHWLAVM